MPDPVGLTSIERRILVKSISSFIEAIANSLKSAALKTPGNESLSQAERSLLADETYVLGNDGEARVRNAKLSTLSSVVFAFKTFAKVKRAKFVLDKSGTGWRCVQRATKLRDRLMHPKSVADLKVSDDDIQEAAVAFYWFHIQFRNLLIATNKSLMSRVDALEEENAALENEITIAEAKLLAHREERPADSRE